MSEFRRRLMMGGGAEPATPVFYNYILFNDGAYVDTDIIPVQDASFRLTVGDETTHSAQRIFGATSPSGMIAVTHTSNTSATTRYCGGYYDFSSTPAAPSIGNQYIRHDLFLTPQRVGFTSNSSVFTKGNGSATGPLVIGYNGAHNGVPYSGVIGTFMEYGSDAQGVTAISGFDSYTPIITLRPCKYNGQDGLWNVEEGKFYGNSANAGSVVVANLFSVNLSSYDSTDKSYYSIANTSNAYATASSSSYSTINLTRGSGAETYVYFKFNTSSLPENIVIQRIACNIKIGINNTTSSYVASRQVQMYSGTTAKGGVITVPKTAAGYFFNTGTWTREELNDVRIRIYAKRGTSKTTTNYNFMLYGATLHVYYTE